MAIPITVPRLGWNMEEGVFAGWLKAAGTPVRAGEPLFTLESEKATEDVEGLDDGILHIPADGPRKGDTVLVGAVIGTLLQPGEAAPASGPPASEALASAPVSPAAATPAMAAPSPAVPTTTTPSNSPDRVASSPRARRVAAERDINLGEIQGTGRTGRIRERDVLVAPKASAAAPVAVSSIRKVIAERMLASHQSTAAVTLTTSIDATNIVNLRNQFKAVAQVGQGVLPSYTDFLIKLTAIALQKHPLLNARWNDGQIATSAEVHIGIAVDTEAGLLVPVLRNVGTLTLKDLSKRSSDLIEGARQRKLSSSDLQGGTFTISSLGSFGIDAFTPIINMPECAILGVGRIQRRAVAVGDQIVARDQITLSLTFDHRIVDGAPAARFLQTLSALIENPGPPLMA